MALGIKVTSKKIDSKAELIENLRKSKSKTLLLSSKDVQTGRNFDLILIKNLCTNTELLNIGIVCAGHGLKTQYAIGKSDEIIIGFDNEISSISVASSEKFFRKKLDSLVYELKIIKSLDVVLVICEADIYCLNHDLTTVWHICMDVIVDYEILDDHIKIVTDNEAKVYKILDGSILP